MKKEITIKFDNEAAATHFALWLCESGEQHYWDWMEYREGEEDSNITATSFHYHGEENDTKSTNDPDRYGEFMEDGIIRTTCGRLDR